VVFDVIGMSVMRTGMIALALGLLTLRFLPALPTGWLLLSMSVLALMLLPFRTYPIAFFLFGFTWACVSAQSALDDRLSPRLDGQTLWLQGKVVGLPAVADGVVRFELDGPQSRRFRLPERIRVAWYGGPEVRSGERWRLAVKLKRPGGLANPHAFDYEAWLLAQRIGATGTVADGQLLASAALGWRDSIRQRLLAVDAQGREGGRLRVEHGRLANTARHRHRAFISDFRAARRLTGRSGVRIDCWPGPLGIMAARFTLVALGLRPGVLCGTGLWPAGRF
jgi:predicted membrane metal-binding protein